MQSWMKPSLSRKRVTLAVIVGMFTSLVISMTQNIKLTEALDQANILLANHGVEPVTV